MKPYLNIAAIAGLLITLNANAQYYYTANTKTSASQIKQNVHRPASTLVFLKFHLQFPEALNDVWETIAGGYVVRFTNTKDIQHWVYLNKKGVVVGQMRYYPAAHLPSDVCKQVRSCYYDFTITSAKEIIHKNETAYLVTIEDESSWKVIQVIDRSMEVYEEHTK